MYLKPTCECSDPGCKAHIGIGQCMAKGKIKVSRYDYEPEGDHFLFCCMCAEDALESGVFS